MGIKSGDREHNDVRTKHNGKNERDKTAADGRKEGETQGKSTRFPMLRRSAPGRRQVTKLSRKAQESIVFERTDGERKSILHEFTTAGAP